MCTVDIGNGTSIKIDDSEEACREFGFKAGDRITNPTGDRTKIEVVLGVGEPPIYENCSKNSSCEKTKGDMVLWCEWEDEGVVTFIPRISIFRYKLAT